MLDLSGMITGAAVTDYRATPRKLTGADLKRVGLPESLWRVRFKGVAEPYQKPLARYLKNAPEDVICEGLRDRLREGQGLLLFGSRGSGKTHVAALVARRARGWRFTVYFTQTARLREGRRGSWQFGDTPGVSVWNRAQEVDVLVLDDVTEADLADRFYGSEALLGLLRERSAQGRVNIVTTRFAVSHPFVTELQASVSGLSAFPMNGPNQTQSANKTLYQELFAK